MRPSLFADEEAAAEDYKLRSSRRAISRSRRLMPGVKFLMRRAPGRFDARRDFARAAAIVSRFYHAAWRLVIVTPQRFAAFSQPSVRETSRHGVAHRSR